MTLMDNTNIKKVLGYILLAPFVFLVIASTLAVLFVIFAMFGLLAIFIFAICVSGIIGVALLQDDKNDADG